MKRKDGVRVKKADPIYALMPYVLDKRYDAMNMITLDIPIQPIKDYQKLKRAEGMGISTLAIVIASYIRAMAYYPMLNRFIVNKRIYQRKKCECAMVVLKEGDGDQEGTMGKMQFEPGDSIQDVQAIITKYIDINRASGKNNSLDKLMHKLMAVPGLPNIAVGLFKFMDKHGMLPESVIEASPFHTSFSITNLASIKTNYIFHHVYEFGTTSVFLAMGNTEEIPVKKGNEVTFQTCIPIGVVMDERICSGHYFANAFAVMKKYITNPVLLEKSFAEEQKEAIPEGEPQESASEAEA